MPPASTTDAGSPWPFGVCRVEEKNAFNFSLYSKHATGVTLLCYTRGGSGQTRVRVPFRTSGAQDRQHLALPHPGARASRRDALRLSRRRAAPTGARPPLRPREGADRSVRAVGLFPPGFSRDACAQPGPTDGRAPLGRLPRARRRRAADRPRAAIHRAATRSSMNCTSRGSPRARTPASRRDKRGTFAGLTEKIPYLKDARRHRRRAAAGAPVRSAGRQLLGLHDAALLLAAPGVRARRGVRGIPGHGRRRSTPRASRSGSTWSTTTPPKATRPARPTATAASTTTAITCWRRTGRSTSTTPAAATPCARGHPAARVLVLESLRFWARTMGVDGFRFDLASIFSRASDGTMDVHEAALVSESACSRRLFNVTLVAEAWDIASLSTRPRLPRRRLAAVERQISRRCARLRARRAGARWAR